MDDTHEPLPVWHRSRLRWINGLGFAISFALALIAVLALLTSLVPGREPLKLSFPAIYAIVTFLALLATLGLFAWIMIRVAWRGERFDTPHARLYIFLWSLAGGLFFICLMIIWLMFDSPDLPNLAPWATDFLWFLCPFGVATFGLMSWTNSDLPHDHDDEHDLDYDEHAEHDEH